MRQSRGAIPNKPRTLLLQAKQRCLQRFDALWVVHTFSLRWRYLQHRRETRQRVYDQACLVRHVGPPPRLGACNMKEH